jgi:hypothetical protein
MSRILLKYHTNTKFYTQYTHPTLIYGGPNRWTDGRMDGWTNGRMDGQTENIYSIFRDKLLLLGEHVFVLSLPLRVYYLMRCTHNALWGVIMNSFDSTISYFGCVSCFLARSARFDITGWYIHTFSVLHGFVVTWRLERLGCQR